MEQIDFQHTINSPTKLSSSHSQFSFDRRFFQKLYAILDEFGLDFFCYIEEIDSEFEILRGREETKWIVLSSFFFGIPGIWYLTEHLDEEYTNPINAFSTMLILTSLISANYWRDAKRGWRRNADLILAKITFATGVYYSFQYVVNIPMLISIFSMFPFLFHFYKQSSKLLFQKKREWAKYHFMFHILLAVGATLTLRGIEIANCIENK